MRKLLVLTCAITLALVVAGCGSSGGSDGAEGTTTTKGDATTTTAADDTSTTAGDGDVAPTDVTAEQYAAAFAAGLTSGDADGTDLVLPKDAAECVAPKFVDIVTVETLNQAGITAEDASESGFEPGGLGLDASQGAAIVAAFGECHFDIYAELAKGLTAGLGEDVQQCTAANIDHDLADAMLAKTFSTGENDAEFEALLADLQKTCDLPAN
ncbi:MAG TPA: hypothetical protein VNQ33_10940 [Acidimicrobiales bacterium]|nr:hypothetical protein [Acidimicrobiales bacterium]